LFGIHFRVFLRVAPPTYGYVLAPTLPQERMQLRNGVLRALSTWLSFLPRAKSPTLTVIFHRSLISASVGNARPTAHTADLIPSWYLDLRPFSFSLGARHTYRTLPLMPGGPRVAHFAQPIHRIGVDRGFVPGNICTRIQSSGDRRTLGTLAEKAVYDMLFALRDTRLQFVGTEMDKSWPDQVTLTTPPLVLQRDVLDHAWFVQR
jgi:hypothetical protein